MGRILLTAFLVLQGTLLTFGQSESGPSAAERIRQTAREQITQQYSVSDAQIQVQVDRLRAEIPARQPLRLQFSDQWNVPRGRTRATILSQRSNGGWEERGWTMLSVSHFDSVVVSRRSLRPDDEVTPDDIHTAWVDVTRLRNQPLSPARYRELRAKDRCYTRQYIREGEVIRQSAVRHPYAARAGDRVTMIYERNGIAAHLQCKARQSGFAGQVVRISCPSTGSIYRARLTEEGTAAWQETL